MKFALLQREAERKAFDISSLREVESPSCLDEVVQSNDGTGHDGTVALFSQLHLLTTSAFATAELLPRCIAYACESHERPKTMRRGFISSNNPATPHH